jgi:hypothetical protein
MLEAHCLKCGDTFNPSADEDIVEAVEACAELGSDVYVDGDEYARHYVRTSDDESQGDECGGLGPVLGEWGVHPVDPIIEPPVDYGDTVPVTIGERTFAGDVQSAREYRDGWNVTVQVWVPKEGSDA